MPDDLPARERILAAAARLFAERGFDHTSTALVAAEARVPQGLIFYHFKTKMELLLTVIREDQASLLDDLRPALARAIGPDDDVRQAVATLWRHLSAVLGEPSPIRKILIQELAAHPEIRQRAQELHEQMAASVACYLARASRHPGEPGPEHQAAARLLTIAAGMAPLLGEPSLTLIPPDALGILISDGLSAGAAGSPRVIAPVLPEQSLEDTDAGWGQPAEPDDNERLFRDRPPHWDSR